jgi:hypothetical protein
MILKQTSNEGQQAGLVAAEAADGTLEAIYL